ncbi:hypothetical protein RSOLAG1IB_12200 [Rhizoctonia solani AG-1 IB]|uniref:Uncharacterized protein n=1 Tax=Thanatephorus cucumeris (strain AG1-IB / isolate 7/3/14) TaxID=1108050 RepID=A0A0B7FPE5_THACB|nr:hypothetical protein RSOLAG1IB_12200 [Rhizoctonia solani AG-1 IB]
MVVLMSGTCKTESVDSQLALLKIVYQAYKKSPNGAAALGPIWSFATDGDARRRLALFRLCMKQVLCPPSPLYSELCHLEFMNLACGEDEITHDGDFKHKEKRFASALRSGTGIYINGTHISPAFVKNMLRSLPDISASRLESLFDNSDCQSVPKAHTLLKGVYDVSQLPNSQKQPMLRPFVLLGDLLYAFYAPHTTPSMSLSQQVVSLAKCAFLLFALFRLEGTRFITSQLYYDIQASIKNAIFCIAKTQLLDPTRPFYLIHTGDDRLENLFGIYRTTSTNRNPDLLQLAERSSAAQEVDNILNEYPNYDRKPYRLSVEGASGIDHLNPRSWTGNVCVANVNLQASWSTGRAEAEKSLRRAGIEPNFNLSILCALAGAPVDLMRPNGHYVGLDESNMVKEDLNPFIQTPGTTANSFDSTPADPDSDMDPTLEELLPADVPTETSGQNSIQTPTGLVKRGWVEVNARWVHLESVARLTLGTESMEKSTDRLRRVCAFTRHPFLDANSNSILGDLCLIGQPILGLIRTDTVVALAAVRVTSIRIGDTRSLVESISLEHLDRSDVTMTGQVLTLKYDTGVWYWNQLYCTTSSGNKVAKANTINDKPLLVTFRSRFIELVNPALSEYHGQLVWSFEHEALVAAIDLLWSKSAESLQNIPVHSKLIDFPYQWQTGAGAQTLVHRDASREVENLPAEPCGTCYLCGHLVPIKHYMRIHIAKHILTKRMSTGAPLLDNRLLGNSPCGFCGRSSIPECKVVLTQTKKSTTIKSSCPFFDKFSHKAAETSTPGSPCTNRPIRCQAPECSKTDPIWSYNMRDHILAVHGQSAYNRVLNEGQFMVSNAEIRNLQLDKPLVLPGRRMVTLPPTPLHGAGQPVEELLSACGGSSHTQVDPPVFSQADTESHPVASGSAPKRMRTA